MISTTLNIRIDIFEEITQTAKQLGKSRKAIIVLLLKSMMKNREIPRRCFSTVKYQHDDKGNWHCFHIRLREDENEFFVDLRKFNKFSVSCILAIAVKKNLDILIQNVEKFVDNYTKINNYLVYYEIVDDIICWRLYWGIPVEHLKTLRI